MKGSVFRILGCGKVFDRTQKTNERKRRITEAMFRIRNLSRIPDPDPYYVGTEYGAFNLYKKKKKKKIWFLQY